VKETPGLGNISAEQQGHRICTSQQKYQQEKLTKTQSLSTAFSNALGRQLATRLLISQDVRGQVGAHGSLCPWSHTHSSTLTKSRTAERLKSHSLTHSLTYSLTHSLTHSITQSLNHSITQSLTLILNTHSFTHCGAGCSPNMSLLICRQTFPCLSHAVHAATTAQRCPVSRPPPAAAAHV
jgi:hypothetical protein